MGLRERLRARREARHDPQRDYLEQVSAAFDGAPGVARLEPRPDDFALVVHRVDGPIVVNLAASYADSREDSPEERAERVRHLVAGMLETAAAGPVAWDEAGPRLRPVLRGLSWLSLDEDPDRRPAGRPIGLPLLAELLVLDSERSMRFVQQSDLSDWGVDLDQALERAHQALAEQPTSVSERRAPDGRRLLTVGEGDSYASSRLLVPGWLRGLEEQVGTALVVATPVRDELWAVPADDPAGLEWLVHTAREAFLATGRGVSPVPVVADGEGVAAWHPGPAHALAPAVREAQVVLTLGEYATQRERLEGLYERSGTDVYVGEADLHRSPDGDVRTWATWARGVQTMLPLTDLVALVPDPELPESGFLVRREDAQDVLGQCSEPVPGLLPPRVRTTGFPDAATLDRLRSRRLDA